MPKCPMKLKEFSEIFLQLCYHMLSIIVSDVFHIKRNQLC